MANEINIPSIKAQDLSKGIMGELDRVALTEGINENIIRKVQGQKTPAMGQMSVN